jgi:hypothetical protein
VVGQKVRNTALAVWRAVEQAKHAVQLLPVVIRRAPTTIAYCKALSVNVASQYARSFCQREESGRIAMDELSAEFNWHLQPGFTAGEDPTAEPFARFQYQNLQSAPDQCLCCAQAGSAGADDQDFGSRHGLNISGGHFPAWTLNGRRDAHPLTNRGLNPSVRGPKTGEPIGSCRRCYFSTLHGYCHCRGPSGIWLPCSGSDFDPGFGCRFGSASGSVACSAQSHPDYGHGHCASVPGFHGRMLISDHVPLLFSCRSVASPAQ